MPKVLSKREFREYYLEQLGKKVSIKPLNEQMQAEELLQEEIKNQIEEGVIVASDGAEDFMDSRMCIYLTD